jgi:catechol 2,3-dioxygenase-like lactoylglutathione lyase family enzyme
MAAISANGGFSSFSTNDIDAAADFYGRVLGLEIEVSRDMGIGVRLGDGRVFIYPKEDHQPAAFTVLNLFVDRLEDAVDALTQAGVTMARYPGIEADERGIARGMGGGPDICWFTDPAGNIIALLQGDASRDLALGGQS